MLAYDHTGNIRLAHYVEPGDIIDWKRNGVRGSYRCRVLKVWRAADGRTKLRVQKITHDGLPVNASQCIASRGVLAVYKPDGTRKEPVHE